ncbi:LptF/LptG family permease [Shimia haliotis]|uniref:Lipopolysaccharide export LptBFGC system, permease protein LptF n=1 Tax=Shimia haliotis TaxID=1280847 RepID=A0A1I4EA03_9RHOB|nr:LptF/LptG family permease [Shimia haliotis]SFL02103.1 Lipopolysaccharide export LptBFGC system, permease protein LptF [Shimia haliotis]
MSVFRPFLRQPVRRIIGWPILWRLLLIIVGVQAIFLAEEFTGLLQTALRFDGSAGVVAKMLMFRMPEIFDLALAFGLLIAVYFAVGEARDNGELVVLATAGIPWWRVVTLVLGIGFLGGVLSLGNAGYVLPLSDYAERVTIAELRKDYVLRRIQSAGTRTAHQTIKDTTFIATPPDGTDPDRNGNLFVYQPDIGGFWRAATSRNWRVVDDGEDRHIVKLEDLVTHEVRRADTPTPPFMNRYAVNAAEFAFNMSDVAPDVDRTRGDAEKLLLVRQDGSKRIADIATRALMVPLAGLLALAALVAGRKGLARVVSLPLAAVVMMAVDVTSSATVNGWVGALSPMLTTTLALSLYLGPPLIFLSWRAEDLMTPDRSAA